MSQRLPCGMTGVLPFGPSKKLKMWVIGYSLVSNDIMAFIKGRCQFFRGGLAERHDASRPKRRNLKRDAYR